MDKQTGKKIQLPNRLIAEKKYTSLEIYKNKYNTSSQTVKNFRYKLEIEKKIYIPEMDKHVFLTTDEKKLFNNICTIAFDYDTIKSEEIFLKNRSNSDRIFIKGVGNKKLSDYFIDKKVDKNKRNSIPLFTSGDNIFWIVGYRLIDTYRPTGNTKQFLYIQIY